MDGSTTRSYLRVFAIEVMKLGPRTSQLFQDHYMEASSMSELTSSEVMSVRNSIIPSNQANFRSSLPVVTAVSNSNEGTRTISSPTDKYIRLKGPLLGRYRLVYRNQQPLSLLLPSSFPVTDKDALSNESDLTKIPRLFTAEQRESVERQLRNNGSGRLGAGTDFLLRENTSAVFLVLKQRPSDSRVESATSETNEDVFHRIVRLLLQLLRNCGYVSANDFLLASMMTQPEDIFLFFVNHIDVLSNRNAAPPIYAGDSIARLESAYPASSLSASPGQSASVVHLLKFISPIIIGLEYIKIGDSSVFLKYLKSPVFKRVTMLQFHSKVCQVFQLFLIYEDNESNQRNLQHILKILPFSNRRILGNVQECASVLFSVLRNAKQRAIKPSVNSRPTSNTPVRPTAGAAVPASTAPALPSSGATRTLPISWITRFQNKWLLFKQLLRAKPDLHAFLLGMLCCPLWCYHFDHDFQLAMDFMWRDASPEVQVYSVLMTVMGLLQLLLHWRGITKQARAIELYREENQRLRTSLSETQRIIEMERKIGQERERVFIQNYQLEKKKQMEIVRLIQLQSTKVTEREQRFEFLYERWLEGVVSERKYLDNQIAAIKAQQSLPDINLFPPTMNLDNNNMETENETTDRLTRETESATIDRLDVETDVANIDIPDGSNAEDLLLSSSVELAAAFE